MQIQNKVLMILFSILFSTSCSLVFDDHKYDYLKEDQINAIKVEGTDTPPEIVDYYPIPSGKQNLEQDYEILPPEQFFSSGTTNEIRLHKLGEIGWVYIESLPSSVWPVMKNFWAQTKYGISLDNPDTGIIRSNELSLNGMITILEMRLEHGIRQASSEIFITHLQKNSFGEWTRVEAENNLEEVVLRSSLEYLSDGATQQGGTSLVALNLNLGKKATLRKNVNGESVIQMNLEFARAWAAVDRALKEALISVSDLDRENGIFYVNFSKKQELGFFKKLLGSKNSSSKEKIFQVFVKEIDKDKCLVTIIGKGDQLELSRDLLSEINQSLS